MGCMLNPESSLKLREEMMLMVRLGGHVTTMTGEEWSKELRPASVIHIRKAGEGEACFLLQKRDRQAKAIGVYCMD